MPVLVLAAACCLQALLVALAVVFAQSAADRAARGLPRAQVVGSIPAGWRERTTVSTAGDEARISIRPPVLLPGAGRWLVVRARSEVTS